MKVYKFFQKPGKDEAFLENAFGRELSLREKYPLYAITTSKKDAKEFMETRDMKLFLMKESKMDSEEFAEYAKVYRNRLLDHHYLNAYKNKHTEDEVQIYGKVLCTETEIDSVIEFTDTASILQTEMEYWINPDIFKKEYAEAFRILKYEDAALFSCGSFVGDPMGYARPEVDIYDLEMKFDQVSAFIIIYQELLSEGFLASIQWSLDRD